MNQACQVSGWQDRELRDRLEYSFERDELERRLDLDGCIDAHVHIGPEMVARRTDAVELARQYRDEGIRAMLIKPFEFESMQRAYFAERMVPGIKVLGGFTLGTGTGGLNPAAVHKALRWGAKCIWLPIFDTYFMNSKEVYERTPKYFNWIRKGGATTEIPNLVKVHKNGKLLPEMQEIMHMIAEAGAILGTSHVSPEESLMLVEEAQKMNLKIVVTHANSPCLGITESQVKEMAKKGAFIEFNFCYQIGWLNMHASTCEELANMIRAAGPEQSIMITDAGQVMTPPPAEHLRMFIRTMLLEGISKSDIDKMTKYNPARLLGI